VTFAKQRAAKLITTDATGGEMLDATRDLIRADITTALSEGYSGPQLAKLLRDNYAFSAKRAKTIAVTEIRFASIAGKLHSWIQSGVVKRKRWLLAENACTICQTNADQGEIGLLLEFKSGDMGPPGHPNCRCDLAAYTE
jgi:SPP1 gp7 family putative phage head morphogenesis protein